MEIHGFVEEVGSGTLRSGDGCHVVTMASGDDRIYLFMILPDDLPDLHDQQVRVVARDVKPIAIGGHTDSYTAIGESIEIKSSSSKRQ